MPIPTPTPTESKEKFLKRCMSDAVMNAEYKDETQRFAICVMVYDNDKLTKKKK